MCYCDTKDVKQNKMKMRFDGFCASYVYHASQNHSARILHKMGIHNIPINTNFKCIGTLLTFSAAEIFSAFSVKFEFFSHFFY